MNFNGLTADDYYLALKMYLSALSYPFHAIIYTYLILKHNFLRAGKNLKAKIKAIDYTTNYI